MFLLTLTLLCFSLSFSDSVSGHRRREAGNQDAEALAWKQYISDLEAEQGRRELWALEPSSVNINIFVEIGPDMVDFFATQCPAEELYASYEVPISRAVPVTASAWGASDPVTANSMRAEPLDACAPITNDLTGQIAVVVRGGCNFSVKAHHAQDAGAAAFLVLNHSDNDDILDTTGMGCNEPDCDDIDIPALFVQWDSVASVNFAATYNLPISIECESGDVLPGGFQYGEVLTTECAGDLTNVMTVEECEEAASALGALFVSVGDWPVPSGCVADLNNEKVWFNTREDGVARNHRRPVCELPSGCVLGNQDLIASYPLGGSKMVPTVGTSATWGASDQLSASSAARAEPFLACEPLTNDLSGKIAIVSRGECNMDQKAFHAQSAGAVAVIILNNGSPNIGAIGCAEFCEQVTIPVHFIRNEDVGHINLAVDYGFDLSTGCESATTLIGSCSSSEFVVKYEVNDQIVPTVWSGVFTEIGGFEQVTASPLQRSDPMEACDPIDQDLSGKIAIILRGECNFEVKALNAQNAGAIAALILNHQDEAISAISCSELCDQITIPIRAVNEVDLMNFAVDAALDVALGCEHFSGCDLAYDYAKKIIAKSSEYAYGPMGFSLTPVGKNCRETELSSIANTKVFLDLLAQEPIPEGAHLLHYLTTKDIGGGRAKIGGLYRSQGYAVSGLHGTLNNNAYDFFYDTSLFSHETGHNFGAYHTHFDSFYDDFIDSCGSNCQWNTVNGYEVSQNENFLDYLAEGATKGTIMSYCDACDNGVNNIELTFHTQVKEQIYRSFAPHRALLNHIVDDLSDMMGFQRLDHTDCGANTHQEFEELIASLSQANAYSYALGSSDQTWDQTVEGCKALCEANPRCEAATASLGRCDLISGLTLTKHATGHVCFVRQHEECCDRVHISGFPEGLQQLRSGTFKMTEMIHDGYPIYKNLLGQMLYYRSDFKDWRIGDNFETAGVTSVDDKLGCPDKFSTWKVFDTTGFVAAPETQILCAVGCDAMSLAGSGVSSSISGTYTRMPHSQWDNFAVWKNSAKNTYIAHQPGTLDSPTPRWTIGFNNYNTGAYELKSIWTTDYHKRDQTIPSPLSVNWGGIVNGAWTHIPNAELSCKLDEYCPSTVRSDSGETCDQFCVGLGYNEGKLMLNAVCRCFEETTGECSQKPHFPVADSVSNGVRTCGFDVCAVPDLKVTGQACNSKIGYDGIWRFDGEFNGQKTWKQVGDLGTRRIAYILESQLPESWSNRSPRWIMHKNADSVEDVLDNIPHSRIIQLFTSQPGDIPQSTTWGVDCGNSWTTSPWTFDFYNEIPDLVGSHPVCEDMGNFLGEFWTYAGSWNDRSVWKQIVGVKTRWIIYFTSNELPNGWSSRWILHENAPSLIALALQETVNVQSGKRAEFITNSADVLPPSGIWGVDCNDGNTQEKHWSFHLDHEVPDLQVALTQGSSCQDPINGEWTYTGKYNGANSWRDDNMFAVYIPESELPQSWTGGRWMVVQNTASLDEIASGNLQDIRVSQFKTNDPLEIPPSSDLWWSWCNGAEFDNTWSFQLQSSRRRMLAVNVLRRELSEEKFGSDLVKFSLCALFVALFLTFISLKLLSRKETEDLMAESVDICLA